MLGSMTIPAALIERLRAAHRVVALTGAGVSAESGVPTFRDAQTGFWSKFKPEDLATPSAFVRQPKVVWEWYEYRRQLVAQAQPNPAHYALAQMERRFPEFQLITQNVDGLHARAGSQRVLELHGNITRTKCFDEGTIITSWPDTGEVPPRCPNCGGLLRPDVVWFEEPMPAAETELAFRLSRTCEVFLCIGTSALVHPAALLPREAQTAGAVLVEINPQPTALTDGADFVLSGPAGTVMPALLKAL